MTTNLVYLITWSKPFSMLGKQVVHYKNVHRNICAGFRDLKKIRNIIYRHLRKHDIKYLKVQPFETVGEKTSAQSKRRFFKSHKECKLSSNKNYRQHIIILFDLMTTSWYVQRKHLTNYIYSYYGYCYNETAYVKKV